MDMAFLGAGALGGIAFVAAVVMAIVMEGGKVGRTEVLAIVTPSVPDAAPPVR